MADTRLDAAGFRDFRPFHRTSEDTAWAQAFARRDACYKEIVGRLERDGIKALVTKSENGLYPPNLRLEAWNQQLAEPAPNADPRVRGELQLQFEAMPYHEHTVVTNARAKFATKVISIAERPDFRLEDAVEWALYAVGSNTQKPSNYRPVTDAILSMIPFARPHHNRIAGPFRNSSAISMPLVLGILGLAVGFVGVNVMGEAYYGEQVNFALLLLFAAAALLVIAAIIVARRRYAISVIDRPTVSPRHLLRLDGWHAVVPDLGAVGENLRRKIIARLEALRGSGILTEVERYGYRTPNGFDERDRIVVSKEQSVAHIHLYQFGTELFVGWDSYINWACWQETGPISARRQGTLSVEYRSLQSAIYVPNQFDLIDVDSLTEVVHRHVTMIIKAAMEEYKIDQEIDFTIVRGDRDSALDQDRYDRQSKRDRDAPQGEKRRWRVS